MWPACGLGGFKSLPAARLDQWHPSAPGTPCRENAKKKDVRLLNIEAAKAVADAIRTSLGPRGADKMAS